MRKLTDRETWFNIHLTKNLGKVKAQTVAQRIQTLGKNVSDLASMTVDGICESFGLPVSVANELVCQLANPVWISEEIGERLVLPGDNNFPNELFLNASPPMPVALWVEGDVSLMRSALPRLGIAGSRNTSEEILNLTHRLAGLAVQKNWVIVSGLAIGVDSAAHQGAIDHGGATVGVLASGILKIGEIWKPSDFENVCFVSEFYPKTNWTGQQAMQRNGTIASLSDRVFIAASGESGGSWEMGQLCLKRNKPLFVLDLTEDEAPGNRRLIKAGGVSVSPDDLEEVFGLPNSLF